MANVLRDRELGVPVGEGFLRHRTAAKQTLAQAFHARGGARRRLEGTLALALDFSRMADACARGLQRPASGRADYRAHRRCAPIAAGARGHVLMTAPGG